jgi:septal ring factor EnvC (AmiA/AmiB activator)
MAAKTSKENAPPATHQPESLEAALIALEAQQGRIAQMQGELDATKAALSVAEEREAVSKAVLDANQAELSRVGRELDAALNAANSARREAPLGAGTVTLREAARSVGISPAEVLSWRVSDDGEDFTVVTVAGQKLRTPA